MWEYNRFEFKSREYLGIKTNLNKIGKDNWEIIYYQEKIINKSDYNVIVFVKRKIL